MQTEPTPDPQYSAPVEVVTHSHNKKKYLIGAAVAVLILVASASIYFAYPHAVLIRDGLRPVRAFVINVFQPTELKLATFIEVTQTETKTYRYTHGSFVEGTVAGQIISEDVYGDSVARITRTPENAYDVVYRDDVKISSPATKAGIVQSSDGRYLAFVEAGPASHFQITDPRFIPMATIRPAEWGIVVFDTTTGKTSRIATGTSPFFINETHLGFLTPNGIVSYALELGAQEQLLETYIGSVPFVALRSPDHSVIAIYDRTSDYMQIFKISSTTLSIKEIANSKGVRSIASYALGNKALYTVQLMDGKAEVWARDFVTGTNQLVLLLPGSVHSTRLNLGAL